MRADRIALVLVALTLTGCGGSDSSAGAPQAGRDPTATGARTATRPGTRPLPTQPGPLAPGTYTTKLQPRLQLRFGRGWRVLNEDTMLLGDDPQVGPILSFVQPPRVVDPRRSFTGEEVPPDALVPTPRDMAGWFARHPRMRVRLRRGETLAGRRVQRVDLRVIRGYRYKNCAEPCVLLFAFRSDFFGGVTEGWDLRIRVVDDPAGPILIGTIGDPARMAARAEVAEEVLRSATFADP